MSETTFKVGDRVRIKSDLRLGATSAFVPIRDRGVEGVITSIHDTSQRYAVDFPNAPRVSWARFELGAAASEQSSMDRRGTINQTVFKVGDRVRIKAYADPSGHLYPMRFVAFRDTRLCGVITAIGNGYIDPHPVTVDFAENHLNPETLDFWYDELEAAPDAQADAARLQRQLDERDELLKSLKAMIERGDEDATIVRRLKLYLSGELTRCHSKHSARINAIGREQT